jgi:hypothetical protein
MTPSRLRSQLSLSACSDPQRAWEGPQGSLTAVLCSFLGQRIFLEYGLIYPDADIWSQQQTLAHHTAR